MRAHWVKMLKCYITYILYKLHHNEPPGKKMFDLKRDQRLKYFLLFRHQQMPTNDPVVVNALLYVCKTMHDSVK